MTDSLLDLVLSPDTETTIPVKQELNYWLIVDTVRLPNASETLSEHFDIDDAFPLFAGSRFDYMLEQSPLVANLGDNPDCLQQWKTYPDFDSSSVVFAVSSDVSQEALTAHLQHLLIVNIGGRQMLFRYYTNVIWLEIEQHQNQLNSADTHTLLGPAQAVYWIDDEGELKHLSNTTIATGSDSPSYHLTSAFFMEWI